MIALNTPTTALVASIASVIPLAVEVTLLADFSTPPNRPSSFPNCLSLTRTSITTLPSAIVAPFQPVFLFLLSHDLFHTLIAFCP